MDLNKLSLVILNYNSAEDTLSCVNQLESFGSNFHIIVVDNNSSDNSFTVLSESLKTSNAVLLQTGVNGGYSFGNNFGIKYALNNYDSELVGILNPDVFIPNLTVIERMVQCLNDYEECGLVGSKVLDSNGVYKDSNTAWDLPNNFNVFSDHFIPKYTSNRKFNYKKITDTVVSVDCIAGCFFITKASSFKQIGLFDENVFLYNEENIVGIKLKKNNLKEYLLTDTYYYHNHKATRKNISLSKRIKNSSIAFKSRFYLVKTYYSRALLPFLCFVQLLNIILVVLSFLKNKIIRR